MDFRFQIDMKNEQNEQNENQNKKRFTDCL